MRQLSLTEARQRPRVDWAVIVPGQPVAWHQEAYNGARYTRPELRTWMERVRDAALTSKPWGWRVSNNRLVRVTVDLFHGDRKRCRRSDEYSPGLLRAFIQEYAPFANVTVRHHISRAEPRTEINLEFME